MLIRALSGAILVILCVGMGLIYQVAKTQIALSEKKSDFVSAVSHELKTPLTSIRMYAEMLKSGWIKDKEKERSYYDFILSESERLSRLIGNVLHLSGIGSGGNALALTVKTPLEVLSFVESKVRSQIESAGFTLTLKVPSELGDTAIRIEDDSITRIFINLVDNALKFAKSAVRKEIEIGLRVEGERVTFFVRDFGPGVPTAQQRKIFELFYRAESELTRTTPGTGIGLALVRELATKLGARVDVTNCAPGAEFRVIFS